MHNIRTRQRRRDRCIYLSKKNILAMKLTIAFMLIATLHAMSTGFAQTVTLHLNNKSLETAFSTIRQQTGYRFIYAEEALRNTKKVSVNLQSVPLKDALDRLVENQPLRYQLHDGTIVLKAFPKTVIRKAPVHTMQQEPITVNGLVTDSLGTPLSGVSVAVKDNSRIGTTTDLNGRYVLEVPKDAVLIFSMVGYNRQEIMLGNRSVLNVKMHYADSDIDEVVVVAYGTQKKSEVVGAMTTINPDELRIPSSNLTTALAGRIAGIIAYQRSGEPGQDNADFFIRGVTSFGTGKVDPLILIDGVEFSTTDLRNLQPDDIASFTIMKDAASTALYGARGANGVILVTTKEGKEGPAKISFRIENSISTPTQNVELADPITYMRLHNEAVRTRDPLAQILYPQSKIDNTIAGTNPYMYPATDWRKELFRDYTMNQRANLSVSGGGKVARYYFAGGFTKDNGVLKVGGQNNFNNNIDLKKYLLRSNVNVNLTKTTEVGVRMYGTFDEYTGPLDGGKEMYQNVMRSNPVMFPAYYPKTEQYGQLEHIMFGGSNLGRYINPYADMVKGYRDYSRSVMMAQFELKQNLSFLTEGLAFRAMANTNRQSYFSLSRAYSPFYYQPSYYDSQTGDLTLQVLNERGGSPYPVGEEYLSFDPGSKTIKSVFYLESALNYNRTFREKHGVSAMMVYIMRQALDANAGSLQLSLPARNIGVSGRFTYNYDSRYSAEFNFGYNGSERFYTSNRFGFFPSGGVAWQVSNEKFWEPFSSVVPLFKLRATYGLVGNDEIGSANDRFFYLSNVNMDVSGRGAVFGTDWNYSNSGVSVSRYENTDITWEIAQKANLGVELKLFNKVGIQADFFSEYRKNILMTRAFIPAYMGFSAAIRANVGEALGRGMDMSVDYQHNFSPDFWITARGNFTYATSKYKVNEEPEYDPEVWRSKIGYPLTQQWGYIAERLFVDDEEVANSPTQNFGTGMPTRGGDIKYRDVNGDGQITPLDQVPIGNPTRPEIVYGFGVSTGYKNFDLSCFFQGLAQESFWIDPAATAPFMPHYYDAAEQNSGINYTNQLLKAYADNHWSEDNGNVMALWPRLTTVEHANNTQRSTWFMRNGSFLRLKNAEFGYTIPRSKLERIGLESIRIYASGINLLTLSSFKLWDVEMAGNGLGYPVQRVYNLGVHVSF